MSIADIINGTSGSSASASNTTKAGASQQMLGRDDFLKLMLAQLKNQDPMKAMDPSEFLGQLAQFSTVSGVQEMQTSIGRLADSMRSSQVLDGSTMIGRDVLVTGDDAALGITGAIRGAVDMPTGAVSAQINIHNAAGTLVRSMPVTSATGLQEFTWDGTTTAGERAAAGDYTVEVVANVGGASQSLETMLADRVNSVTIDATKGLTLNTTSLGARALSDVRRVM